MITLSLPNFELGRENLIYLYTESENLSLDKVW